MPLYPPQKGFTLLELMIAVAMISIIVGLSFPNLNMWVEKQKLSRDTRAILEVMNESRAHAIAQGTPVVVSFSTGVGSSGTFKAFEDTNANFTQETDELLLGSGNMGKSVAIESSSFETTSGNSATSTCFDGMGLAVGHSGKVVLKDIYNQKATLILTSAGIISITTGGLNE